MKFNRRVLLFVTLFTLVLSMPAWAGTLYSQPFDGTGNALSSQNDTNGLGVFAQMYDNFTLGGNSTITEVQFTGEYFNPPALGPITGWTVTLYSDSAGQPGGIFDTFHVGGTGGETFLGFFGGFPAYTYDITGLNFAVTGGTQYWLSVYPDLGFPPQWGWSTGTGGDGSSYQDFFGARSLVGFDMAFNLIGTPSGTTPEPSSLILLGTGILGLAGSLRRKLF